jgi:chemosensory pili system protein ChpA (sensor histidine kinase/response regulator)
MDETFPPSDQNELSPEDQAVLDAFLAMEEPEEQEAAPDTASMQSAWPTVAPASLSAPLISQDDDMLVLFATEAEEDIARMQQALDQLKQDERLDAPAFESLHRAAHKLKGTAGAIGYNSMSAIARHIEMAIGHIKNREVVYGMGLLALTHTVQALETTLESIVSEGHENQSPRIELEKEYQALSVDISGDPYESAPGDQPAHGRGDLHLPSPAVRVDTRHLDQLMLHTEQMLEQHASLESAQKQVEIALQELHKAQARLRRLEALYNPFSLNDVNVGMGMLEEQPESSLVERILHESAQRTGHVHKPRTKSSSYQFSGMHEIAVWDELEVDRFTESHVLAHSLSEGIADVATATTQLRLALAQLNTLITQHMAQTVQIRNDALSLRAAPFHVLVARLRSAAQMITTSQKRDIQFEVSGEATEIDQDILDALANPFLELVYNSVTDSLIAAEAAQLPGAYAGRITLTARSNGNEVAIELGFSMPVPGGTIEALNNSIHHLRGSITPQRDSAEGITFHLRFPRSQGMVQGLLVRAGNQSVVVPFSQVHHIDYSKQESISERYDLNTLLGFPSARDISQPIHLWLILQEQAIRLAVRVDEIIGQVDLVMKPLAEYLRRPGITGTAIDGMGNVLLVIDLLELITQRDKVQKQNEPVKVFLPVGQVRFKNHPEPVYQKILIADDSVYMRQSVRQILERVGYTLYEAHDGVEALEQILEQPPDLLLLDIEMPNLNGFDLLTIIRANPLLSKLKTILLTSRSSDKHRQHALDLGARAFLTKPCPPDVLLEAVQSVLS